MAKVKLTKGELKRQRDALRQYERYLPTLLLKKQQLQMEILNQISILKKKELQEQRKKEAIETWSGLLVEPVIDVRPWIRARETIISLRNIAGVDLPLFDRVAFEPTEYDLFIAPLWVDVAIDVLREFISIREEIAIIKKGIEVLKHELRVTAQRVNLFEKIKIPEAKEAIRSIKIYLGDQMANAVGRSKIAKKKIEKTVLEEVLV